MSVRRCLAVLACSSLLACGGPDTASTDPDDTAGGPVDTETTTSGTFTLSTVEQEIHDLLMAYRADEGLPPIPVSPSLSRVARTHAIDQVATYAGMAPDCNPHSWSDQGDWSACCYTADHAQARCMWDKPGELTEYVGAGYEITSWSGSADTTAALAVNGWKGSPGHNAVIVNLSPWEDYAWGAVGVGVDGGFANVWFGTQADPAAD